jgi:hypothetical protein
LQGQNVGIERDNFPDVAVAVLHLDFVASRDECRDADSKEGGSGEPNFAYNHDGTVLSSLVKSNLLTEHILSLPGVSRHR